MLLFFSGSRGRIRTDDQLITLIPLLLMGVDYLITISFDLGVGRSRMYSSSLCTFLPCGRLGSGLSQWDFPEFTQCSFKSFLSKLQYFTVNCSTAELPGIILLLKYQKIIPIMGPSFKANAGIYRANHILK